LIFIDKQEGYTALHHCIDMQAIQALQFLLKLPNINIEATDRKGRTFIDLARDLNYSDNLLDLINSSKIKPERQNKI
jgi:ankyrin repeat protein